MATHGMIDLETLGVEPDSVIITVGAIKLTLGLGQPIWFPNKRQP